MTNDDMSSSFWMSGGLVEELGLSIIPSKYVSGRKRRTYTKCTLTDVEDGSMITQTWNKEITQLVPILVDSHADNPQVHGIIVAISKGGSDKYGVSNPQGAKGKINILSSPICHSYDSTHA